MAEIIYRKAWASMADAKSIAKVHVDTWQAAYRDEIPQDVLMQFSITKRTQQWQEWLNNPESVVYVAEESAQVIGFVSLGPSREEDALPNEAEIYGLYVHPNYWRRKVGGGLLKLAMQNAVELGYKSLALWVLKTNQQARTFYESHGLSNTGKEKTNRCIPGIVLLEVLYKRTLG